LGSALKNNTLGERDDSTSLARACGRRYHRRNEPTIFSGLGAKSWVTVETSGSFAHPPRCHFNIWTIAPLPPALAASATFFAASRHSRVSSELLNLMKTINPKVPAPETKARALTRALAYMMADRYVDQCRREWQAGIASKADDLSSNRKRKRPDHS
jgi:hypothetical protein